MKATASAFDDPLRASMTCGIPRSAASSMCEMRGTPSICSSVIPSRSIACFLELFLAFNELFFTRAKPEFVVIQIGWLLDSWFVFLEDAESRFMDRSLRVENLKLLLL